MEFKDPKGIYLQIADQVRERILEGEWIAGGRIPSVREMAIELGVNPNTVARSYQTLVENRIVINQRGRGYFVGEGAVMRIREDKRREFLQEELPRIIQTMQLLHIGPEEIAARFPPDDDHPP